jgi:PAS domain S-box-containing protein
MPAPGSHDLGPVPPEGELLRALADNIPAMLAYWDSSLRCRFANRAYELWFGVSPAAVVGEHISDFLGPLYALNRPHIEAALRGERQEFEREIADPFGGPARQSLVNYLPDIVDGAVRGFFVLVTDISAVKRAELALRECEWLFRLTIDEAPIGMALVAPDGRFVRDNRVLCEILGYTAEELRRLTFQAVTHPADLDADLALLDKLARGELARYQLGKRYIRKDAAIVDILLSVSVLRSQDGTPRYYIAQIEDVTERRRIHDDQTFLAEVGTILASTLDFEHTLAAVARLAVQQLADCVILDLVEAGADVRRLLVVHADPSKAELSERLKQVRLDRRRPHLVSTILDTQQPTLISEVSADYIASVAQGEEHHRVLLELAPKSLMAVPLLCRERLLGALLFISSDSARRYGPRDLELAKELAHRAALAIDNARLYEAARRATQARDDVLGIVAHDLRNPLSTILMQAAQARRHGAEPDRRDRKPFEVIERAARRMHRLIHDLLDVTRIEAGRLSIEQARVLAGRLVSDAVAAQEQLAASASLGLQLDVAQDLPDVWADRDRLLQVFENLIGNAVKFTASGGRVTVGAAPREGEVVFWVTDTGAGISADEAPHLFDRFWQAQQAGRHGAGLGLPIAKDIVESHGGRIWVESTPGQGSTFFFTIPTARRAEAWLPEGAPHRP